MNAPPEVRVCHIGVQCVGTANESLLVAHFVL